MVYRSDRNQHGGGVILLVHKDIRHDTYAIPITSRLETVAVIVQTTHRQNILIVFGYNPPTNIVRNEDIKAIFKLSLHTIFMGDFNGKHMTWNCASNNRTGKIILDFCTEHSITISAPTQYTYFPSQGQASTLDIVMSRGCVLSPPPTIHTRIILRP
jgi:endonuclease/exonuclease/phosphatase family metal-dependent hydrolase